MEREQMLVVRGQIETRAAVEYRLRPAQLESRVFRLLDHPLSQQLNLAIIEGGRKRPPHVVEEVHKDLGREA